MTTYVLVHGGDRDGHIWEGVARLLRHQGNQVFCPSMKSIKETTLQHNINEICELIQANQLNDIILVGHSYGAMVITGVLNQLSDAIHCMVYIDSVIPQSGKSLFALLAENGFNDESLGLTPDTPCIEPLLFDENKLKEKLKAYIHCLKSEFSAATKPFYDNLIKTSATNHWLYFDLNTTHACMLTQPEALAVILAGMQVL
jgi:pimeloyl-ACP methyl ester carboxylesterase